MLLALQADYADWLAALPDSLQGGATAEALETIVDLDLTSLADIDPPRGYGAIEPKINRPNQGERRSRLTPTTPNQTRL